MTPNEVIQRVLVTPYIEGGSDWTGLDCWGVVERWHADIHGVALPDRGAIDPGILGMQAGFQASGSRWIELERPQPHAVAILRTAAVVEGRRIALQHGHCGVFWQGRLLHSEATSGPKLEPVEAIASRVTCWLLHPDVISGS